jgi:ferredoxin-NADP reductase
MPRAGLLSVQVLAKAQAARDAMTFWLAQPGARTAPAPYLPGHFITFFLPTTARGTISRSYSLCGDGQLGRPWEITVKRQSGGVVSSYLLEKIQPGMVLQVTAPAGNFVLPEPLHRDVPLIFIATGSGITALYGMLRAIALLPLSRRPRVELHYAYRSPADGIYVRELIALDPQQQWLRQYHYLASSGHRLSGEGVVAHVGASVRVAHWYICGSAGLKRSLEALLLHRGAPRAQIHVELFASPRASATVGTAGPMAAAVTVAHVRLADSGAVLEARGPETLLETLERYGYRIPYNCRTGSCGTCRLRMVSGQIADSGAPSLTPGERPRGYILSCVASPRGDVVLESAGGPPGTAGRLVAAASRAPRADRWRGSRTALRWTLAAAALAFFLNTWHLTSGTAAARTGSGSNSPTQDTPSSSSDDNGSSVPTPTPTPSGSGGITTGPSQSPPITSSGTS